LIKNPDEGITRLRFGNGRERGVDYG